MGRCETTIERLTASGIIYYDPNGVMIFHENIGGQCFAMCERDLARRFDIFNRRLKKKGRATYNEFCAVMDIKPMKWLGDIIGWDETDNVLYELKESRGEYPITEIIFSAAPRRLWR